MKAARILWAFAHGQPDPEQPDSVTAARLRLARQFAADAILAVTDRRITDAETCARLSARFARAAAGYKGRK